MNLHRNLGHSFFMGCMVFAGQESIAFPTGSIDGWAVDFVTSLRSSEHLHGRSSGQSLGRSSQCGTALK
jgi:hypothetical protein